MTCGIYSITNTKNKKRYVGSAVDFDMRWRKHLSQLRLGNHHSGHLQAAWNKYGENSFKFEIIACCEPDELIELEQFYISAYNAFDGKYGYNISPTAGSQFGIKRSDKTRERMTAASFLRWAKAGYKEKISAATREAKSRIEYKARASVVQRAAWAQPGVKENRRGERNGQAKLTDNDVRDIKRRLVDGETTVSIAIRYGVSHTAIGHIKHGRSWSHVK